MKKVAVVLSILPLALIAGACSRQGPGAGSRSVVAPEPPSQPVVQEASWITDRAEVASAASRAAAHPLVREALEAADPAKLAFVSGYALRGVGRTDRGGSISVTILPYITQGDPTHATFLSLLESDGDAAVSHAEMIWGRDPRPDETGFSAFSWGGARGWLREDDLRTASVAPDGSLSPERFNRQKFLTCFETAGPQGCSAGASIANQIAPSVPYHEAAGCAAGVAIAAIGCAAAAWAK